MITRYSERNGFLIMKTPQDSYVDVAYADDYFSIRLGADKWAALDIKEKESLLVAASDFIDANYKFKFDLNYDMKEGKIPVDERVKKAVCAVAINPNLKTGRTRDKEEVKIDVIQVKYSTATTDYDSSFANISGILGDLIYSNGAFYTFGLDK